MNEWYAELEDDKEMPNSLMASFFRKGREGRGNVTVSAFLIY